MDRGNRTDLGHGAAGGGGCHRDRGGPTLRPTRSQLCRFVQEGTGCEPASSPHRKSKVTDEGARVLPFEGVAGHTSMIKTTVQEDLILELNTVKRERLF